MPTYVKNEKKNTWPSKSYIYRNYFFGLLYVFNYHNKLIK